MPSELKPCPFCGGKAVIKVTSLRRKWYYPSCDGATENCPGVNDEQDEQGGSSCDFKTEAEAIKAWNRRPLEAALSRLPASGNETVKVRRLEWKEPSKETNGCWTAASPLGTYSVVNEGGWHAGRDEAPRDFYFEWSGQDMSRDTLYAAQDACQSDFESRIRSSLVSPAEVGWRHLPALTEQSHG